MMLGYTNVKSLAGGCRDFSEKYPNLNKLISAINCILLEHKKPLLKASNILRTQFFYMFPFVHPRNTQTVVAEIPITAKIISDT
ncbi:hypothetical protein N9164_17335 [Draconibacterium sp.]|nr:hypothetical protein [Draconibacterium sp.]